MVVEGRSHLVPLPGLRGVDHVGLTVPDINAAVSFFEEGLGFVEMYRHGPYSDSETASQEIYFDRHPRSVCHQIVMMRCQNMNLELFQFSSPDQSTHTPKTSDWGASHLAFYVVDMDAAVARLSDVGARVLGGPLPLPGPEAACGALFCFFVTPWRQHLELITYPHGKAYEAFTDRRLYSPVGGSDEL